MTASAPASDPAAQAILGGFALERLVGQGGMADVWLGRHRIEGQPAAIKVITRRMADDEQYREGLRREVRAVAGLDHPNIVPVFDAGTVDATAAAAADGALVAGSPWLAMHYAEHGELRRLPHPMPWPLLREVLLQILDGLAHAHARGVVHRDLKPENVLLHIESDRLRLMLTDFGIAHVVDAQQTDGGASANSAGTPHYMAPEQFKGRWRDYGPWTDLYALGCMAFELATGQPPFTDKNLFGIAHKHLTADVPPLRTPEPMPVGFEGWIARMMRREPHERFQSAADAAWALGRLTVPDAEATRAARLAALEQLGAGEGGQATEVSSPQGVALAETQAYAESDGVGHTLASVVGIGGHLPMPVARLGADAAPAAAELPPMPETWFVDTPERPLLRGVGLGLFGVRAMPFVDRDAERDALWSALRDVRENGHARLMVLRGTEGSGKSRLARWFARRATEVGAAEFLEVRHSPMDAPGDAVAAAIDGWFRGAGLERPALEKRIAQRMAALDPERRAEIETLHAPALARFVRPDGDRMGGQMTPRDRFGAVHGWLHALSRRRPVVIVFDDVQWCDDTVGLVEWLLSHAGTLPVLMVATLRSDLCKSGTFVAKALGRLAQHPRAEPLTIGPLSPLDHRRVVGDLLGLHPLLAEQLLGRTDGNPLFAEQIIADWIERSALMPTELGYMCNGTALVDVPPDLHTLALRRVDRLAARFVDGEGVKLALEAAAVLGHAVRIDEWQAVFAAVAGRAMPEGLQDALYDAGLAVADRGGWIFGHGFVRDALLVRTQATDRGRALHLAAAGTVCGGRAPDERRARHLMFGGEKAAAIDALLAAARRRMDASEYRRAMDICDWRLMLMDKIQLPPDDVRRAEALPIRVEALRFLGHLQEAVDALTRFRRFPFGPDQPFLLAEAERLRGGQAQFEGKVDEMSDAYRRAIDLYRVAGDPRGEVRARHGLGWAMIYQGSTDAAERMLLASDALARQAGLLLDEAWAVQGIGAARMFAERSDAVEPLERALALFEQAHAPIGVGSTRLFLAEVHRQRGDFDAALRLIRSAYELGRLTGSHLRHLARYIWAMVDLDAGDEAAARRALDGLRRDGGLGQIHRQYGPSMRVVFGWLALVDGDLEAVDAVSAELASARAFTFMHPHARRVLGEVAEGLESRGERRRAALWWRLAADFNRQVAPARAEGFDARARAAAR